MAKTNDLTLSNFQSISQRNNSPRTGQPSISITPLPGRGTPSGSKPNPSPQQSPQAALKPGQPTSQGKSGFVICEICDGYIKDLEQLRNHMQWIHKVRFRISFNLGKINECQCFTHEITWLSSEKLFAIFIK
jgi:hypothetical protein